MVPPSPIGCCHNRVVASQVDLVVRLLIAAALAGAIGLEREISDQPAGLRTHILVGVGACLFALISAFGFSTFLGDQPAQVTFDPSRVAAQIVTGIGFLGAGAIIRYGMTVRGLTTAASLWVVAAIGLAVALAEYWAAGVATGITLVALRALKRVRPLTRGLRAEHQEFVLETEPSIQLEGLVRTVSEAGLQIDHLRVEEDQGIRQIILVVVLPRHRRPEDAVALLLRAPGVRNVDWTR